MAQFFREKSDRTKKLSAKVTLEVTHLDHLGAGIAEYNGKVVFIPQALPSERVSVQLTEQKKRFARAKLLKIETQSHQRITPQCQHYSQCGGCDLQHLSSADQGEHKLSVITQLFDKLTNSSIKGVVAPIVGKEWGYRRRTRLATYYDKNSKQLTLGFRAAASHKVIPISRCPVLTPPLSQLIGPLSQLLNTLSCKRALGHVELLDVDSGHYVVLRITKALSVADQSKLAEFVNERKFTLITIGNDKNVEFHSLLDKEGLDKVELEQLPFYRLNAHRLSFKPGNFIQVNADCNQQMVNQAVDWLDIQAGEQVLDLFCGVGNFSLALATAGANVIGVEGVPEMVAQAKSNALNNGLTQVQFFHADLSADLVAEPWLTKVDKLLLDPARAGAMASLRWLKKMKPKAIVYVSCDPSSLARDSDLLLKQGYQLERIGLIDMFPQTHHIETMALFTAKQ